MPYDSACAYAGVEPFSVRRYDLGRKFFAQMQMLTVVYTTFPNDETQILFLDFNDIPHIAYPIPRMRTNKYRSFIHFALAKYQ